MKQGSPGKAQRAESKPFQDATSNNRHIADSPISDHEKSSPHSYKASFKGTFDPAKNHESKPEVKRNVLIQLQDEGGNSEENAPVTKKELFEYKRQVQIDMQKLAEALERQNQQQQQQ